jgi:hypothetical protein
VTTDGNKCQLSGNISGCFDIFSVTFDCFRTGHYLNEGNNFEGRKEMKKILAVLVAMTALAGCGDNSSSSAPAPVQTNPDRTLTLNMSNPAFLKSGGMGFDISGVAASNDSIALSVPVVSAGTLGLGVTAIDKLQSSITVLPDTSTGNYKAYLTAQSLPAGNYKLKAVSVGNGPGFKTYSTSVNYTVN